MGLFTHQSDDRAFPHVGAFDGATFALRWSANPSQEATRDDEANVHLAVAENRVVVTVDRTATVYDLQSGATIWRTRLGFDATELCVHSDATVGVRKFNGDWVKLDPRRRTKLLSADARSRRAGGNGGALREAGRCLQNRDSTGTSGPATRANKRESSASPTPDNKGKYLVYFDGAGGFGISEQGDRLYGFTREEKKITWTAATHSMFGEARPLFFHLAGTRLYWKASRNLFAIDATTGNILWKAAVSGQRYTLTDSRMYIPSDTQLSIIDLHSGTLIGGIGK